MWPGDAIWPENFVNIGSGNGLSPVWCQAITWTITDLFSIRTQRTNFSETSIKIQNFSVNEMCWNVICKISAIFILAWVCKQWATMFTSSAAEFSRYSLCVYASGLDSFTVSLHSPRLCKETVKESNPWHIPDHQSHNNHNALQLM